VDRARGAERARQRVPLASGPEDVEDRVHGPPVVHPRAAWPVHPLVPGRRRDERPHPLPELVRNLIPLVDVEQIGSGFVGRPYRLRGSHQGLRSPHRGRKRENRLYATIANRLDQSLNIRIGSYYRAVRGSVHERIFASRRLRLRRDEDQKRGDVRADCRPGKDYTSLLEHKVRLHRMRQGALRDEGPAVE